MSPDDLADNGKTQSGSFFVFTPGEICLVKALPDLVLILFGNTDTVVLDADEDFAAFFRRLDLDLRVVVAEFDGVVHQIVENLLYFVHIGVDIEDFPRKDQLDPDTFALADLFERGGHFSNDIVDIPVGHVKEHALGVEVIECQERVGELGQALGLIENDAEIVLVHLGRNGPVQHGFQKTPDGRQGRAEVVGDICNEFFLVILGICHCFGHISEGCRQIAHLVLSLNVQLVVHVAGRVLFGRRDDPPKRSVYDFREEDQNDYGQEQDHDEHQIRDVQKTVGVLVDLCGGFVNDHIAPGLVIVDDGRDDAQLLLFEKIEERSSCEVVLLRDRGVKTFYDDLLLRIRCVRGVDDHTAGGIDDPDLRIHEVGEGFHLILNRFQGDLGVVQIYRIRVCNS